MEVGIRELKLRLSHYIAEARRGEPIVITDRGKPVARIQSIDAKPLPPSLQRLVDARLAIDKGPPGPLPSRITMLPGDDGKTAVDYVREQRR